MIIIILLAVSLVCFALAALQPTSPQWNRLVAAGLAAFALTFFPGMR